MQRVLHSLVEAVEKSLCRSLIVVVGNQKLVRFIFRSYVPRKFSAGNFVGVESLGTGILNADLPTKIAFKYFDGKEIMSHSVDREGE